MRKYLLVILFLSIGIGQDIDNQKTSFVNESTFKSPKLYCSECQISMRETITRYVCRDNHMSVKKSNVKINEDGKLYIVDSNVNEKEYNGLSFGSFLIAASGAMGLYMNNADFDDLDELKTYNNVRFGLLLVGGLLLK